MAKILERPDGSLSPIYGNNPGASLERQADRYTDFCLWAEANGHNPVEFLLPQIRVKTTIEPFSFETRFAKMNRTPPSAETLARFEPWHYTINFGAAATRKFRLPMEWHFHRYRSSMLVGLARDVAGEDRSRLSVLDVACHCGVFALDFAERGFGSVRGLDLREENIRQAQFLAETFGVPNTQFSIANARMLGKSEPADIVFCAGLLYHLTFPMELLTDLFNVTREFAIIDTCAQKHPFSGFHLICSKDTDLSIEGEAVYELMPTYRGVVDALHAVGFEEVYEILGDRAAEVPGYQHYNVRSFLAVKNRTGLFEKFRTKLSRGWFNWTR